MDQSGAPDLLAVSEMGDALRSGATTSEALTRQTIERVWRRDGDVHAFVSIDADAALAAARGADRDFDQGIDKGPLQGIPYAVKDNFDVAGMRTQCNSRLLSETVATADSAGVAAMRAAGAILMGKLSMTELAYGLTTDDVPWPPVRNPWHLDHMPGGSSSGPAAAVAAGFVGLALGSDTSTSIRGPAANCGIVGLKPTFGRISRHGLWPLSATLDHAGVLSRTVRDAAIALQALAGHDARDGSSAARPVDDYLQTIDADLSGLRIAVPRAFFGHAAGLSPDVLTAFDASVALLAGMGAVLDEIALPDYDVFDAAGRIILTAEAFALYETALRETPARFGRDFYTRVMPGLGLSATDLVRAHELRLHLAQMLNQQVFSRFDAIVTVTCLTAAPPFVAPPDTAPFNPTHTMPFSLTGHPALAMPMGFSNGLPTSLQIVGAPFSEAMVLRIANQLEARLGPMLFSQPKFLGGKTADTAPARGQHHKAMEPSVK